MAVSRTVFQGFADALDDLGRHLPERETGGGGVEKTTAGWKRPALREGRDRLRVQIPPPATGPGGPDEAPPRQGEKGAEAGARSAPQLYGRVVDSAGRGVSARVAVVGASGSYSTTTSREGTFALRGFGFEPLTLHASTRDGRVAVLPLAGTRNPLTVRLDPGVSYEFRLEQRDHARLALFQGDRRIEDFTLRRGRPARVVLPPGPALARLYDGAEVHAEARLGSEPGSELRIVSF